MYRMSTSHQKGMVTLVLLSLVFASMGLFARYLSTGFSVLQQVYLRVFAAFVLGMIVFNKDLDWSKLKKISFKEWLLIFFRGAAFYVFGVVLFTKAIILTKYSNVSFISALPATALLGTLLFKEKLTWQKTALLITAFLGVVFITVKDYSNIFMWGRGEIITLVSTLFFSLNYVTRKWHSKLLNSQEITQLIIFFPLVLLFITSLAIGEGLPVIGWNAGSILVILIAGTFNVGQHLLINYGFKHVKAILASNILTLESLFAVILGYLFYREVPNLKELIGGIVIILSVVGMNKLENR